MLSPRRLAYPAAGLVATGVLAGCGYNDPRPPTGQGRTFGIFFILALLVPLIMAGLMLWHHLRARRIVGGRPGSVWIAVCWCFLVALVVGLPGLLSFSITALVAVSAVTGSATRGDEQLTIDFGTIFAFYAVLNLGCAVALISLGLSVRRGAPWSRWVATTVSALVSLGLLGIAAVEIEESEGKVRLTLVVLGLLALVPIPFLFGSDAEDHFAPRRVASPVPPPEPERFSEARTLNERWHSRD